MWWRLLKVNNSVILDIKGKLWLKVTTSWDDGCVESQLLFWFLAVLIKRSEYLRWLWGFLKRSIEVIKGSCCRSLWCLKLWGHLLLKTITVKIRRYILCMVYLMGNKMLLLLNLLRFEENTATFRMMISLMDAVNLGFLFDAI